MHQPNLQSTNLSLTSLILLVIASLFIGCTKEEVIQGKRYLDKVTISSGDLSGLDILSGPDLKLAFGENAYLFDLEVKKDVREDDFPITWTFTTDIPLTDAAWLFKITDIDELNKDELVVETSVEGLLGNNQNPVIIAEEPVTVEIHWKVK